MGKIYRQLSLEERYTISFLQKEGKSIRQIGAALARAPSTIAREIKRNTLKTLGYQAGAAAQQTAGRRWKGSRLERQPDLRKAVLDRLAMGWSPQQVSNRLAQAQGCRLIGAESIYRFIYAQIKRTKHYHWRHYLPRGKSKRGKYGRQGGSPVDFIKDRVSIHQRSPEVSQRLTPGHWEADLMLFSQYGQSILVVHERYSRFLMAFILKTKQSKGIIAQLKAIFDALPPSLGKSMTFDNGTEFAHHYRLNKIGVKTYFCDVRSPWQKGGIENAIGRLRRPLPRKTNLEHLTPQDLYTIIALYNHTPRRCLGYHTPAEVFREQLLHFKWESTWPPTRP